MQVHAVAVAADTAAVRRCPDNQKYGMNTKGVSLIAAAIPVAIPRKAAGIKSSASKATNTTRNQLICPNRTSLIIGAESVAAIV
jgi:hypothetical protein